MVCLFKNLFHALEIDAGKLYFGHRFFGDDTEVSPGFITPASLTLEVRYVEESTVWNGIALDNAVLPLLAQSANLLAACKQMLEAYAPQARDTLAKNGRVVMHFAVLAAIDAIDAAEVTA